MLLPLIMLLAQTPHQGQEQKHMRHTHRSPEAYAKSLEASSRDAWQKPDAVVEALALKPGDVVADIGAGSGYFTRRLARHAAKVYAVDIDSKLLEKATSSSPANVTGILAAPDDPKLPPASVDTVFFCDVLHHVDDRVAYLGKLKKALKPGGRIVIIDFHKKQLPVGPPVSMKLAPEQVTAEYKQAGFHLAKDHGALLEHQYFLEYRLSQ